MTAAPHARQRLWAQAGLAAILAQPFLRAATFVACALLLYAPKYLIGQRPPGWLSVVFGGTLSLGALLLARLDALSRTRERLSRHGLGIVVAASLLVAGASIAYVIFQFELFSPWPDSAKLARALWLVVQGQGVAPVLGLDVPPQTHVTPTWLLLLPTYALVPTHLTMLVSRTVLMAAAAIPLFLVVSRWLPKDVAVGMTLAYLLNFTTVYHLTGGAYEMQLFPLVFFLACWAFERQWFGAWLMALWLIGGVREEVICVLFAFALLAYRRKMPARYWVGGALLGAAWLLVSYELLLGLSRGGYAVRYHYAFARPATGLARWLNAANLYFVYGVGLPFALVLPFLGSSVLLVLPVFLGILSISYPLAKVPFLQYGLPVVCGFVYASARHIARLASRCSRPAGDRLTVLLGTLVLVLTVVQTLEHFSYEKSLHPPFGGTVSVPIPTESPIRNDPQAFRVWIAALRETIRRIPDGHQAAVPAHVMAHLPHQPDPLDYGYERLGRLPEFVLVDNNTADHDLMPRMPEIRRRLRESYQVAYAKNGVVLYSRREPPSKKTKFP